VADVPTFQVKPPIRCCRQLPDSPFGTCGEPAGWQRTVHIGAAPSFFCDEHRGPNDAPIAGELVFNRVSVQAEVVFCATSFLPGMARAEALARLTAAVEAGGGLLSLTTVTSQVGRYVPPAPPRKQAAGRTRVS